MDHPQNAGHYCIQAQLDWPDDANALTNLGQTNTDVRPLNSPQATFRFPVCNAGRKRRHVQSRYDGYRLPSRERCSDQPTPSADIPPDERELRLRRALDRHTHQDGLPEGMQVSIEPSELILAPVETREIAVEAIAPGELAGRVGINVNAFDGAILLGGVTLYAEGHGG